MEVHSLDYNLNRKFNHWNEDVESLDKTAEQGISLDSRGFNKIKIKNIIYKTRDKL